MLYIYKQYKTLYSTIIMNNFAEVKGRNIDINPETWRVMSPLEKLKDNTKIEKILVQLEKILAGEAMQKWSKWANVKVLQEILYNLWYDISYTKKSGEKIEWLAAIDSIYGNTMVYLVNILQADLRMTRTWIFDKNVLEALQKRLQANLEWERIVEHATQEEQELRSTVEIVNSLDILNDNEKFILNFDLAAYIALPTRSERAPIAKKLQKALIDEWYNPWVIDWQLGGKNSKTQKAYRKALGKLQARVMTHLDKKKEGLTMSVSETNTRLERAEEDYRIAVENYQRLKNSVSLQALHQAWVALGSVMKLGSIETIEQNTKFADTVLGLKVWDESRSDRFKDVNSESLRKLLRKTDNQDLQVLVLKMKNALWVWDLSKFEYFQYFAWVYNYWKIIPILEEAWYEFTGLADIYEVVWVITTILDYAKNGSEISPENINSQLTKRQKIQLLFDFDKNGVLDIGTHFYVWEAQLNYQAFDSITTANFNNIVENLWLWNSESILKEMQTNLFATREKFQRELWVMIERWFTLSELSAKDWVRKALKIELDRQKEYQEQISEIIEAEFDSKLDEISRKLWTELSKENKYELKKLLKLLSVRILVGSLSWIWAGFDITEYTKWIIDSIDVWMVMWHNWNMMPGIVISKELYKYEWLRVSFSNANIMLSILNIDYEIDPKVIEKVKALGKISWDVSFTLNWSVIFLWILPTWFNVGWTLGLLDKSKKWIEKSIKTMRSVLESFKASIKNWENFEDTIFNQSEGDKALSKLTYTRMQEVYKLLESSNLSISNEDIDEVLNYVMNGYLRYYETQLYVDAQWSKITSVWAWLAFLAWFLPFPYLTIWTEKINTKWSKILHSVGKQREVTKSKIDLSKFKLKLDNFHWTAAYSISINSIPGLLLRVSDWRTPPQFVEQNWMIFIWWHNLENIAIDEHTTAWEVTYTLVINWWKKVARWVGKWLYVETEPTNIWIPVPEAKKESDLFREERDAMVKTSSIRSVLYDIVQEDAWRHKSTEWMLKLQKMIFNYKIKWIPSLEEVWKQFILVITYSWFKKYAKEKLVAWDVVDTLISNIRWITVDSERVAILQSISASLTKKWSLKNTLWVIALDKKKYWTLRVYDTKNKRAKFFNGLFKVKYSWLTSEIINARASWIAANGSASSYSLKPVMDGSVAFTWVQTKTASWKRNISWVMPFTWGYNIVSVVWGQDFIEISSRSEEIINNTPRRILEWIMRNLNTIEWIQLNTIQEVITFINAWWNKSAKVDYKLAFARMWECINDVVILKNLTVTTSGKIVELFTTWTSEVYKPTHEVMKLWLIISWDANRQDNWDGWWANNTWNTDVEGQEGSWEGVWK